jgi:hypothetical protein
LRGVGRGDAVANVANGSSDARTPVAEALAALAQDWRDGLPERDTRRRLLAVLVREFVDLGHSGAKVSLPALDELKHATRAGGVGQVMVVGVDRLGRSLRDLLVLLDDLAAAGCAGVSLREGVGLSTPAGRLQVQILGALAEFERELSVGQENDWQMPGDSRRPRVLSVDRHADAPDAGPYRYSGVFWHVPATAGPALGSAFLHVSRVDSFPSSQSELTLHFSGTVMDISGVVTPR